MPGDREYLETLLRDHDYGPDIVRLWNTYVREKGPGYKPQLQGLQAAEGFEKRGVNLAGLNLRHANLEGADLRFIETAGVDLNDTNLHKARFDVDEKIIASVYARHGKNSERFTQAMHRQVVRAMKSIGLDEHVIAQYFAQNSAEDLNALYLDKSKRPNPKQGLKSGFKMTTSLGVQTSDVFVLKGLEGHDVYGFDGYSQTHTAPSMSLSAEFQKLYPNRLFVSSSAAFNYMADGSFSQNRASVDAMFGAATVLNRQETSHLAVSTGLQVEDMRSRLKGTPHYFGDPRDHQFLNTTSLNLKAEAGLYTPRFNATVSATKPILNIAAERANNQVGVESELSLTGLGKRRNIDMSVQAGLNAQEYNTLPWVEAPMKNPTQSVKNTSFLIKGIYKF